MVMAVEIWVYRKHYWHSISNEGEMLFEPLRKAVDARTYIAMDIVPLKIVGAKLGNQAGIYGAYCIAKENI